MHHLDDAFTRGFGVVGSGDIMSEHHGPTLGFGRAVA